MDDNRTTPSELLRLYERVKTIVRDHANFFKEAGVELDAEYSDEAMRHQLAVKKNNWRKLGRVGRQESNAELSTNASFRKLYGNNVSTVEIHDHVVKQPDGKFRRLPRKCKCKRFSLVWGDTLGTAHTPNALCGLKSYPLDRLEQPDRLAMAKRVILLTWLQVDPDAHTFRPLLTDFQDWLWRGYHWIELWERSGDELKARKAVLDSKGKLIDQRDYANPREEAREKFLDRDQDLWQPHLEAALEIVANALPPDAAGGEEEEALAEKLQPLDYAVLRVLEKSPTRLTRERLRANPAVARIASDSKTIRAAVNRLLDRKYLDDKHGLAATTQGRTYPKSYPPADSP